MGCFYGSITERRNEHEQRGWGLQEKVVILTASKKLHRILVKARRGLTVSLYSSEKDWPCHKLVLTDILTIMSEERKRPRAAANLTAENEEIVTLEAQLSFGSNRHIQGRTRAASVLWAVNGHLVNVIKGTATSEKKLLSKKEY